MPKVFEGFHKLYQTHISLQNTITLNFFLFSFHQFNNSETGKPAQFSKYSRLSPCPNFKRVSFPFLPFPTFSTKANENECENEFFSIFSFPFLILLPPATLPYSDKVGEEKKISFLQDFCAQTSWNGNWIYLPHNIAHNRILEEEKVA